MNSRPDRQSVEEIERQLVLLAMKLKPLLDRKKALQQELKTLRNGVPAPRVRMPNFKPNAKSGYYGVSWCARPQMWYVYVSTKGKSHYVGCSKDITEAARMYNKALDDMSLLAHPRNEV